jgi:superkiller protein 3
VSSLSLLLPQSPYNKSLSASGLPNDTLAVYQELIALTEAEEREAIEKEVQRRRQRLDSSQKSREQVEREVGVGVWSRSQVCLTFYANPLDHELTDTQLPSLYDEVLNHPATSDELRRSTEAKLLRFRYAYLKAVPVQSEMESKKMLLDEVKSMVDGIVLLGIPNELAWTIFLNLSDVERLDPLMNDSFLKYAKLFPGSGMSQAIKKYRRWRGFPPNEASSKNETAPSVGELEPEGEDLAVQLIVRSSIYR